VTRRYRQALAAITAFGLTLVVSFAILPGQARQYWLGGLFLHQQRVGDPSALPDQSLDGMISRLAGPGHGSGWYAWLAAAVIVGACGLLLAALAHERGLGLLGIVTCAVTGLLVSPISWDHHWVWIVPLPVAALALIRERGVTLGTACLVAVTGLFLDYPVFSGAEVSARPALDGLIWGTGGNPDQWHGVQLITGNLYVLAGLAILCAVALVIAETPQAVSVPRRRPGPHGRPARRGSPPLVRREPR
jgi:alpha-1,2-mannosyltransferase